MPQIRLLSCIHMRAAAFSIRASSTLPHLLSPRAALESWAHAARSGRGLWLVDFCHQEIVEWETIGGFQFKVGSIFDALKQKEVSHRLNTGDEFPIVAALNQRTTPASRPIHQHRSQKAGSLASAVRLIPHAVVRLSVPRRVRRTRAIRGGTSGQAILDAVLSGQRDPVALAQLCHSRVQSPRNKPSAGSGWRTYRPGTSVHPEAVAGRIPLLPEPDLESRSENVVRYIWEPGNGLQLEGFILSHTGSYRWQPKNGKKLNSR